MAQQKTDAEKKKQEELKAQYEKEQDLYVNKSLVSKESKEKLSVNFLYEPPPGMKKEREKEDGEPEFKFEWQRKYNAPREDYCRDNEDIRDQPFGIAVRNVRCIKCHKWGHVNTDRECPLFNKARDAFDEAIAATDPSEKRDEKLMNDMKETGLAMTKSAISTLEQMAVPMQGQLSKSEEPVAEELTFLKTLSTKEKKKLLKKLEKLEDKEKGKKKKKKKSEKRESRSPPRSKSSSSLKNINEKLESISPPQLTASFSRKDDRDHSKVHHNDGSRSSKPYRSRDRRSRSRERGDRGKRRHEETYDRIRSDGSRSPKPYRSRDRRSRSKERVKRRHEDSDDRMEKKKYRD